MVFIRTNLSHRCSGFTLTELLVATAISGLTLLCVAALYLFSQRSFVGLFNYADMNDRSRNATDLISRDIRSATAVISSTTNQIVLGANSGANISYAYDSVARTLTRAQGTWSKILLTGVDSFGISLYQRPVTNATYNVFPSATAANAKMVAFQWSCSRKVPTAQINSESIQGGIVEIRNE